MAQQTHNTQTVDQAIKIAEIGRDIVYIKDKLDNIEDQVGSSYVTKEEFEPIKRVVYGVVGLILIAVMGGLVALVVK
jgi:hypothetical protein